MLFRSVKRADMINGQGIRQQGMQELDIISIVKSITKYAALVTEPEDIRYHLDRAVYEATTGRKGPVWLDIPLDVQAIQIEEDKLAGWQPEQADKEISKKQEELLEQQVLQVIEHLNHSERPVLLAGNGIRLSGGIDMFHQMVDELQIPVLTTWNGIDLIEDTHPLFFGCFPAGRRRAGLSFRGSGASVCGHHLHHRCGLYFGVVFKDLPPGH